jgi:hypothetical protein
MASYISLILLDGKEPSAGKFKPLFQILPVWNMECILRKASDTIAGLRDDILTLDLRNTMREHSYSVMSSAFFMKEDNFAK